jgi:LmbE family N-acetylglucosaminyl deacetylase
MRPWVKTATDTRDGPLRSSAALAVVAHPDDESFGLGAVLSTLQSAGTKVAIVCFTHGEASTLGAEHGRDELHALRAAEMTAASQVMGLHHVELHDLPVLASAIPEDVAQALNREFGTAFSFRPPSEIDYRIRVDRQAQLAAIACHRSQSAFNPVLWRRLELTGADEPLRLLRARPEEGRCLHQEAKGAAASPGVAALVNPAPSQPAYDAPKPNRGDDNSERAERKGGAKA